MESFIDTYKEFICPKKATAKWVPTQKDPQNIPPRTFPSQMRNPRFLPINSWKVLTWICNHCNQKCYDYKNFRIHLQNSHHIYDMNLYRHRCYACDRIFLGYIAFVNHIRSEHHSALRLRCDACSKIFPDFENLSLHREKHNETPSDEYPILYQCNLCQIVNSTEDELKNHIRLSHNLLNSTQINENFKENVYADCMGKKSRENELSDNFLNSTNESKLEYSLSNNETHIEENLKNPMTLSVETHEKIKQDLSLSCMVDSMKVTHNKTSLECVNNSVDSNPHSEESQITTKSFQCEICTMNFEKKADLKNHTRTHAKRSYQCEICKMVFLWQTNLKTHMYKHTGERPYKCELCSRSLTSFRNLKVHMLLFHTDNQNYKCGKCSKTYSTERDFKSHLVLHAEKRAYKCEVCSKEFSRKQHLRAHMIFHTGKASFHCEICEKSFTTRSNLESHLVTHNGEPKFECEICQKHFRTNTRLTVHMYRHTGERPFKCPLCPKATRSAQNLRDHTWRYHSDERPFECILCSRNFATEAGLKNHECKVCLREFSKNNNLERNMTNRTGERRFKCEICREFFRVKSQLLRHYKICKENLKPTECKTESEKKLIKTWNSLTWKCYYCREIFNDFKTLESHIKSLHRILKTNNIRYRCDDCDDVFYSYAAFVNHIRNSHYDTLKLCCDICNDMSIDYEQLSLHRNKHIKTSNDEYPNVYHCTVCEIVHTTKRELKDHLKNKHNFMSSEEKEDATNSCEDVNIITSNSLTDIENVQSSPTPNKLKDKKKVAAIFCKECLKIFPNESDLKRHMKQHDRSYKCVFCYLTFKSEKYRKIHMKKTHAHADKPPFICHVCNKKYSHLNYLKVHMRTHTGERPYKCEKCEKTFIASSFLKKHKDSCEKHLNRDRIKSRVLCVTDWSSLTWTCFYCSTILNDYEAFKSHVQTLHGNINPDNVRHQCSHCNEDFPSYACFLNHFRKTHHRPMKLCCDVCNEYLPNYYEFSLHRSEHNNDKSSNQIYPDVYHCTMCEKVHSNEKEFKNHIQESHAVLNSEETIQELQSMENPENIDSTVQLIQCKDEYHETTEIFQCGECTLSFASEIDLKNHMSMHTKSEEYLINYELLEN